MNENHLKINRRQFLARAGAGALAAMLAPGMLAAAGRNVAPVEPGNPLFTGALGRYEGVTIMHTPGDALADLEYYAGDQWSQAQQDLFTRGSAAVKVYSPSVTKRLKGEWIPINRMIRKG
jgi:hypothetical protein